MKKFNTSPISGTQELLPNLQAEFDRLKVAIEQTYAEHGFQHIETPMIERAEVLLAKAGGDTEKQIYKVVKTAETSDEADQALRFDHTVPLARYVVEHMNDLAFPFKVTQVARNFRGERAQKGRFREFYQCDVDVIGWQQLPIAYDADVISTLTDALKVLPLEHFVVRVSNRKILAGLLENLELSNLATEVFEIIDHAEKVPESATIAALTNLGLSETAVQKLNTFTKIQGNLSTVIPALRGLKIENETFRAGVSELSEVLTLLSPQNDQRVQVVADMLIVRGLDYYTGTVFETISPEHREFGSLCSGGRYENLAQNYTDQALPGVGGSIGLTRIFAALRDGNLLQDLQAKPIDYCILPITSKEYPTAETLAGKLRQKHYKVDVALTNKKLGDKIKYASKIAQFMIIVGEDEARTQKFSVKNLETGEQQELFL